MDSDVFLQLVYSLAGLIVGFFFGRLSHEVHEVKERLMSDHHTDPAMPGPHVHGKAPSRRRDGLIGFVTIVLAVVSIVVVATGQANDARRQECENDYASEVAAAVVARSAAAAEDRAILIELVKDITNSTSRQESATALQHFIAATNRNDKIREAQPFPDPPEEVCK